MRTKRLPVSSLIFLALFFGSTSCSKWSWRLDGKQTPGSPKAEVADASDADESGAQADELRLFGRDGRMEDVAFEGKAATDLQQHTKSSEGADFDPDVDPTGKFLAFASTRHASQSHLYVKSIGGATITQITDGPANDAQPEFDPTGSRIAFTSDRGGHWDIWIIDANGRNPIQVSNHPMPELHPTWSPDGKRLAYCRVNPKEDRGEIWIIELDQPGIKRLIGEGLFPAWSPNGDKIAYQRARAQGGRWFSIWTIDFLDNEVLFPTEVASHPNEALISPTWSPDGMQLAFSFVGTQSETETTPNGDGDDFFSETFKADIGIVDIDGRGMQRLTADYGRNYSPTWSAKGRIFFSSSADGAETLWSVRPFRPPMRDAPSSATTASDRRAAQVTDMVVEEEHVE